MPSEWNTLTLLQATCMTDGSKCDPSLWSAVVFAHLAWVYFGTVGIMGGGRSLGERHLSSESQSNADVMFKQSDGKGYLSAREEINEAIACSVFNSVTPDNLVAMADGTTKPI